MKGSRALLKMLEDRGVNTMFGYPGGSVIPIYDEILDSSIRHVLVRHEQCAAHMADGYARASGKTGVCLSTSGPGATNMVTGIATAYADSVPMLAFTGQVGTKSIGLDAFQEVDAYSLMMAVTKHNFRALTPEDLAHDISEGWDIARTGRQGPVHIDLPVDLMNADINPALLKRKFGIKMPIEDVSGISIATNWITQASRPVIFAGGGVISANASSELIKLAEMTNIPVVTPMMGLGCIPSTHPLNMGPLGMHGKRCTADVFSQADLIIAVGTKFSDRTYSAHTAPGKTCKVIQIDIDGTSFGKHGRESVDIKCDAKKGLELLTEELKEYTSNHLGWTRSTSEMRKRCRCKNDYYTSPIIPQKVMYELNHIIDDNTIITTDVGQNQMWAMHFLDIERPRQFLSSGSFGTMGFGLPAAIGAKAARPECTAIAVVGDGGMQMTMQELATAVSEDLPVVTVILNNGWLGMVKQWQKLFWNKRYSSTCLKDNPDFVKIAEAYHAKGIHVEKASEIREALHDAVRSGETCVVDIFVDPEEDATPMLPPDPKASTIIGRCTY